MASLDLSNYKVCNKNDIVLNRLWAFRGGLGRSDARGLVSPDYAVLRPTEEADPKYLHYLFRSSWFVGEMSARLRGIGTASASNGRKPRLNVLDFGAIPVRLPDLDTQRRIACHLDEEARRIDETAERIRALRSLVEERLEVGVVVALTRQGRDVEIGMYGSDYWIGDVPENWEVAPLGTRYKAVLGKMLNEERSAGDQQAPYLSNVDVRWDGFNLESLRTMSFPVGEWERYGVEVGDLLVCEGGEIGRAAVWSDPERKVYFQKALHRLRPIDSQADEPRFLMYALMAAAKLGVFQAASSKATIDHLTGEKLAEHRFPFPPVSVQRAIVRDLDRVRGESTELIYKLNAQDMLLAERKQALITAAVTGEITV